MAAISEPAPPATAGEAAGQRPWSLRRRMLVIGLGVALLAWLVGGVVTYGVVHEVNSRLRDSRLVELAETVRAFADHELAEVARDRSEGIGDGVHTDQRAALDARYRYQLWSEQQVVLASPDTRIDQPLAGSHVPGFHDVEVGDTEMRVLVLPATQGRNEIQMAELMVDRALGDLMLLAELLPVVLMSLVVVAVLALWLVMRAIGPVERAGHELRARKPGDLASVRADGAPTELQPLIGAFNQLLQRVAIRLSRERGFTALAAHELRTPLAALRMQAQVAERESDPERRARQLGAMRASVDRCDHLLEQLLSLARVEQDGSALEPLDLATVCDEVVVDLAPDIARRGTDLQFDLAARSLHGEPFAIRTLLRNLVANAVAYSPDHATVRVSSRHDGDAVIVTVDDSGPGIPVADRPRVFERFVRLDRGTTRGVGLGLSIVRAVAELHHAGIELQDSQLGGLRVRLHFPVPAAGG